MTPELITAIFSGPAAVGFWKIGEKILDSASKWSAARDAHARGVENAQLEAEIWARNKFAQMFDQERAKLDDMVHRFTAVSERVARSETEMEHLKTEVQRCHYERASQAEEARTLRDENRKFRAELDDIRGTLAVITDAPPLHPQIGG